MTTCIRDVLTSMECTAQWLENGCDAKEAAAEIRLAMGKLTSTDPNAVDAAAAQGEPVAQWQWRWVGDAEWKNSTEEHCLKIQGFESNKGLWETRALYARPLPRASDAQAVALLGFRHCQSGNKDVCRAGQRDGVACPDDSCDIDDGVRKPDAPATAAHAGATLTAAIRMLEGYAESYDSMARMGDRDGNGAVQCRSVARDIRHNMAGWIKERLTAPTPVADSGAMAWMVRGNYTELFTDLEEAHRYATTVRAKVTPLYAKTED